MARATRAKHVVARRAFFGGWNFASICGAFGAWIPRARHGDHVFRRCGSASRARVALGTGLDPRARRLQRAILADVALSSHLDRPVGIIGCALAVRHRTCGATACVLRACGSGVHSGRAHPKNARLRFARSGRSQNCGPARPLDSIGRWDDFHKRPRRRACARMSTVFCSFALPSAP